MFETRFVCRPTNFALETAQLQHEYYTCWQDLRKHFIHRGHDCNDDECEAKRKLPSLSRLKFCSQK